MLVLGRYKDEVIHIGDDIKIVVVDVWHDGRVRLGIEAPAEVGVWRSELLARDGNLPSRANQKTICRRVTFNPETRKEVMTMR